MSNRVVIFTIANGLDVLYDKHVLEEILIPSNFIDATVTKPDQDAAMMFTKSFSRSYRRIQVIDTPYLKPLDETFIHNNRKLLNYIIEPSIIEDDVLVIYDRRHLEGMVKLGNVLNTCDINCFFFLKAMGLVFVENFTKIFKRDIAKVHLK